MTTAALALPAPEQASDLWQQLEGLDAFEHERHGDATREYAHRKRAEYRQRLAELTAAIARAERWYAARCDQLAAVDRRAAQTESRLLAAGLIRAR